MPKMVAYRTGTTTMVRTVPKARPAMMVIAMPTQKTSCSREMTPSTVVAAANSKGQSFSLASNTSVSGFVFEMDAVDTRGSFTLEIYRAMDGLPWLLSPVFSDAGMTPASGPKSRH